MPESTQDTSIPATVEETAGLTAKAEAMPKAEATPAVSTLLEFPGAGRANRPQWRKDLSERVREIQERRAREAGRQTHAPVRTQTEQPAKEASAPQLGLVPQPDQPQVNPLVVAALKRIERAYQPTPQPRTRPAMGGAAVAVARVAEEQYQLEQQLEMRPTPVPAPEPITAEAMPDRQAEPVREHTLTVVQAQPVEKASTVVSERPSKLLVHESNETLAAEATESDEFPLEEIYDDRAPVFKRLAAGLLDLLVVAFASSPFAAIIELTNGNWADERVLASMGGILLLIMFLYLTSSTALAGRTWGMSLVSLRAVDVDTGLPPTTKQSVTRAITYMLSLATLGIGILYALFDAEGRTAHDHFSSTAVVRD